MEGTTGETIIVAQDGNGDYENIQNAIDNAIVGDTIRVWDGIYYENVVVDKSVSLVGNGSEVTTIDGGEDGDVVWISADWCNVSWLTINGSGISGYPDYDAGIRIESNYNTLSDNNISNNEVGIILYNSDYNTISNNTWSFQWSGIQLRTSDYNTLSNNTCYSNNWTSIYLWYSNACTIENNTCSNNGAGILLYNSSNCTLSNNTCSNNSYEGIYLWYSNTNSLKNNTISGNGVGIRLKSSSQNNTAHYNIIYHNIEYGIDASDNSEYPINATHNYWGDASGPYHPTKNSEGKGDNITDYVNFNERPRAYVDDISPTPALDTDSISFEGHGTDDGFIIRIAWHSDIDRELYNGTNNSFTITNLSLGEHNITFRVQDNYGLWSDVVNQTLIVIQIPIAIIESITPNPALDTDVIHIQGNATDNNSIFQFAWRSSVDGEFYNDTKDDFYFETLSNGSHTIYLKVQDGYGTWSDEVSIELEINGVPRAFIDIITPNPALEGKNIQFEGYGMDDESIVLYVWTSNIDGELYNGSRAQSSFLVI